MTDGDGGQCPLCQGTHLMGPLHLESTQTAASQNLFLLEEDGQQFTTSAYPPDQRVQFLIQDLHLWVVLPKLAPRFVGQFHLLQSDQSS